MEHAPDHGTNIHGDVPLCGTHHPIAQFLRIEKEPVVEFHVGDFADVLPEPGHGPVPEERSRPVDVEEAVHLPPSCAGSGAGLKISMLRDVRGGVRGEIRLF